jgi:glycyl-tRNA synthetase
MPFASASVGKSFRNEISPRAGLLRVREFLMAEIEHFVDPLNKRHTRFAEVADVVSLRFLPREVQEAGETTVIVKTIGEAVREGMVDNETLGYFLARIHLFLQKLGVDSNKVRFRQHMPNEMAHYATDCWDADLLTSYGWIECVGCADRSAFDLSAHSARSGEQLVVRENLEPPKVWEEWDMEVDKKWLGPKYRKDAKKVEEAISNISQEDREKLSQVQKNGSKVIVNVQGLGPVELEKVTIKKNRKSQNSIPPFSPPVSPLHQLT